MEFSFWNEAMTFFDNEQAKTIPELKRAVEEFASSVGTSRTPEEKSVPNKEKSASQCRPEWWLILVFTVFYTYFYKNVK